MSNRVLIVDDDSDFNTLLTDVYRQAGYEVISCFSAEEGFQEFQNKDESIDVLVTDQRLPGASGSEFAKEVLQRLPGLPIIMVSGHLESDTVRELIETGVGGVFAKPLNVFQLLKKTQQLIEKKQQGLFVSIKKKSGVAGSSHSLGFRFTTFACVTAASIEFAKALFSKKNFTTNLLLIGSSDCDYELVCRDLLAMEEKDSDSLFVVSDEYKDADGLLKDLTVTAQGKSEMTILVSAVDVSSMHLLNLVKQVVVEKMLPDCDLRCVIALDRGVDNLLDDEVIDEDTYIFLGTTEIKVPALTEIVEESPFLLLQYLNSSLDGDKIYTLSDSLEQEMVSGIYSLEMLPLKNLAGNIGKMISPGEIDSETFKAAYDGRLTMVQMVGNSGTLKDMLREKRDEILKAVLVLSGNPDTGAEALACSSGLWNGFLEDEQ
ncbi:MAG: response regulator [Opitutales bacterium]|nr:response regulator [Opitutales bacterium]